MSRLLRLLNNDSTKAPPFLAIRSSKIFILLTVALSIFTDLFLYGVIVPVVPFALQGRAGVSASQSMYSHLSFRLEWEKWLLTLEKLNYMCPYCWLHTVPLS